MRDNANMTCPICKQELYQSRRGNDPHWCKTCGYSIVPANMASLEKSVRNLLYDAGLFRDLHIVRDEKKP